LGASLASAAATPDCEFDRRWARNLLDHSYARLKDDYRTSGKALLFERVKSLHSGDPDGKTCLEVGSDLAMSESAVKSALHRMRRRHREILREEIRRTVHSSEDFEQEVRHFIQILGGKV
jgi:hypothetical protein